MADLKMNGSVTTIAFFADGKRMISGGSKSEIHVYSYFKKSCPSKTKTLNSESAMDYG